MKFASFHIDGRETWGALDGDDMLDIGALLSPNVPDLRSAIAANALNAARAAMTRADRHAIADIVWRPVIPNPGKILCIGLNYKAHKEEAGRADTAYPTVFVRFADSQLAHGEDIVRPRVSARLDYEGELAIIIGTGGRYIPRDQAMRHVAGYACYNDGSIRDWQRHTTQFLPGKNFPATGAFGPVMVTADEIDDYRTLQLETRLNGEVVQKAGLDQLIFDIPTLIEYCSAFTPLAAGDVIVTGTPGGVGFLREPPMFMKPGDRIEVEVSGIGLLSNGIADEI